MGLKKDQPNSTVNFKMLKVSSPVLCNMSTKINVFKESLYLDVWETPNCRSNLFVRDVYEPPVFNHNCDIKQVELYDSKPTLM